MFGFRELNGSSLKHLFIFSKQLNGTLIVGHLVVKCFWGSCYFKVRRKNLERIPRSSLKGKVWGFPKKNEHF